jgi:3-oxoacyl-[acyl-carrier protein] reductase
MDLQVSGKVFFIAAASKGLGYAIARQLASNGASIAIASRNADAIREAATALSVESGQKVVGYVMDAADADSINGAMTAAVAEFGRLDGLLVNAGGPPPGEFEAFCDADWQAAFNLTLMSAVRMINAALPSLKENGGAILAITSSYVKEPVPVMVLSNVMRAGVTSLLKTLSRQYAADNIRVNNLVPGLIYTDRIKSLDTAKSEREGTTIDEAKAANESLIPFGRYGEPDEFGKAGAFLLSSAASYITGATLTVDGGSMRSLL